MARERDPNRDIAFEIYRDSNGYKSYKDIAEELDILPKTVSAWKTRDRWDAEIRKKSTTNGKDSTIKSTNNSTKAINSNPPKKRSGNPNPQNQFAQRNEASKIHGLYSRYIPQETLEIMNMLDDQSPADILWSQIKIQYAMIMRSQEIMYVASKKEMVKEINKVKSPEGIGVEGLQEGGLAEEIGYDIQYAWDRQANFMTSLSRAQSELRGLVKQFNLIADEDDERRLKLDAMQVGIVKNEIDIEIKERELELLNGDNDDKNIQINFVRK